MKPQPRTDSTDDGERQKETEPSRTSKKTSLTEKVKQSLPDASEVRQKVKQSLPDASEVRQKVKQSLPDASEVRQWSGKAVGSARDNPLTLALISAGAGFIVGMLAPVSRIEMKKIPPLAQRGRQLAEEAGQKARQTGAEKLAHQIEEKGEEVIDAFAGQVGKIPGVGDLKETAQQTAKEALGSLAEKVKPKATGTRVVSAEGSAATTTRRTSTGSRKETS